MAVPIFDPQQSSRRRNYLLSFYSSKPTTFIVAEWLVEIVVGSSSALQKESIAHFSAILASCLGGWPNF